MEAPVPRPVSGVAWLVPGTAIPLVWPESSIEGGMVGRGHQESGVEPGYVELFKEFGFYSERSGDHLMILKSRGT